MSNAVVSFIRKFSKSVKILKFSVVKKEFIEGTYEIGAEVQVIYGKSSHLAVIKYIGEDKALLDQMRVSLGGELSLSKDALDKSKKKSKSASKSGPNRKLLEAQQRQSKVSSSVAQNINKFICSTDHVLNKHISDTNLKSKQPSNMDSGSSKKTLTTDQGKPSNCVSRRTRSSALDEDLSSKAPHPSPAGEIPDQAASPKMIMLEVTPEEHFFVTKVLRNPKSPKLTAAGIGALQEMAQFYESLYRVQLARRPKEEKGNGNKTAKQMDMENVVQSIAENCGLKEDGKEELYVGSGVYIRTLDKESLTARYRDDPMDLARRLLKNLIGGKILAGMSALGTRSDGFPGIPSNVYGAVKDFIFNVVCKSNPSLDVSSFNHGINIMCGNLRRKHRLSISSPISQVTSKGTPRLKPGRKRKGDSVTLTSPAAKSLAMEGTNEGVVDENVGPSNTAKDSKGRDSCTSSPLTNMDQRKSSPLADITEQVCMESSYEESDVDDPLKLEEDLPDSVVTPTEDTNFYFPDISPLEPVNLVNKSRHSSPFDGLLSSSANILDLS